MVYSNLLSFIQPFTDPSTTQAAKSAANKESYTITGEIGHGHILNRDLFQEGRFLTAGVSTNHPSLLKPQPQPG